MESLSSIEREIRSNLKRSYNGLIQENRLIIEFSKQSSNDFENKQVNDKNDSLVNIDRYCDYIPLEEKIVLYLPVIEKDRLLPFSDDLLVRLLLWEKIGNWLTQTLTFPPDHECVPKIVSYNNCGEFYQSFCALSFAFRFVKDSILRIPFDVYLYKTSKEYDFLKLFQQFNGVEYQLPGLTKVQIFGLIQHARYENRLVTRDCIMDFYTCYMMRILNKSPHLIHRFKDFFSPKQREHFQDDSDMGEK